MSIEPPGSGTATKPSARARRLAAGAVLLSAACSLAQSGDSPPASAPRARTRPNLLLITLDTTRVDHLGCYGRAAAATPNLDALARAGVVFENALSPAPLTLVSHATIMTGLVPRRHGVRDNAVFRLDASHPTLASVLKTNGYRTAAAVASAVLDRSTGLARGFQAYDDRVRTGQRSEFNFEERGANQVTVVARRLLDDLKPPFFFWVHYYDPHYPYVPPPPYAERFAGSPYDGEIAFMDERIGGLLDALKSRGLESTTVVAVAGDHGESLGEHGEEKHDLFVYQATQRVPLILKGPRIPAGRRIGGNVGLVDLYPSLLDLLGLPPTPKIDGRSLVPLFRGGAKPHADSPERGYEMESFFPAYSYNWAPSIALVSGRWKHIAAPRPELYDLIVDPAELHNLIGGVSGRVASEEKTPGGTAPTAPLETFRSLAEELLARYATDPYARSFGAPYCEPTVLPGCPAAGGSLENADPSVSEVDAEDSERRKRLAALGYVGGSVSPGQPAPPGPHLDPKDGAWMVRDLDRGRELLQAGKDSEAVRVLEPLAAKDPQNFPVLATLGTAYMGTAAFDTAIETLRRASAMRPDYELSHSTLANALRAKAAFLDGALPGPGHGEPNASALRDEAAAEFEKALGPNPRDSESYLHYAELELERSRPEAARAILERADHADAGDPEVHLLMGRVEASLGDSARARAAFEKVLAEDARSGAAHEALGRLDYGAGNARSAEAHYARALELTPSVEVARTLGAIRLDSLSDREGALAAFRRALMLARDASDAREIADVIRELEAAP